MDLLEELIKITARFDSLNLEYALCGGLALAVYARPRATLDIDIMVDPSSFPKIMAAAEELGYRAKGEPLEFHDSDVRIQRLLKIEEESRDTLVLDLVLSTPATQEAWESRRTVEWRHGSLKVVSPRGLILLKSLRGSGQDQDDIDFLRTIDDED